MTGQNLVKYDTHTHEIYVLLYLKQKTETKLGKFFQDNFDVPESKIERGMHLTVYYSRRLLKGLNEETRSVAITADITETRFMVFAPGGENPRPDIDPARSGTGIRLTKRNLAIPQILALRKEMFDFETPEALGSRDRTTNWNSAWGSHHYQPHIKLIRSPSGLNVPLTEVGAKLRAELPELQFGKFLVQIRPVS